MCGLMKNQSRLVYLRHIAEEAMQSNEEEQSLY